MFVFITDAIGCMSWWAYFKDDNEEKKSNKLSNFNYEEAMEFLENFNKEEK
ncbi:hypothetical protein JMF89_02270 [Clostridiaceae bacterium UIB06]|uniref:Uncharacterized protein n=1 Tax=Clostridium thailandense TaxID=2794346 RepID=A0A949TZ27_9CLOT|nr:hypothetical protein [Clostridium thailandense]MBV7273179.1 hypothetical protein [Clostridium thailandense]MCH5136036.1 hypothetical protein [Clostridiaceae bacterium UIB06]